MKDLSPVEQMVLIICGIVLIVFIIGKFQSPEKEVSNIIIPQKKQPLDNDYYDESEDEGRNENSSRDDRKKIYNKKVYYKKGKIIAYRDPIGFETRKQRIVLSEKDFQKIVVEKQRGKKQLGSYLKGDIKSQLLKNF